VDPLQKYCYELKFNCEFLDKRGEAFQEMFASIMEKRYPGDFIRTRPWGAQGDRKNDGYIRSKRVLFQVYAPNELTESNTLAKIDEDYHGALRYWSEYYNTWVFVHNSKQGLGPGVTKRLLDLGKVNENVRVVSWGFEELRQVVFELGYSELASLLGPMPNRVDVMNVQYTQIEQVLRNLESLCPSQVNEIHPVPPRKLEVNCLSSAVSLLLRVGMSSSYKVRDYFSRHYNPELGDRVAHAFRSRYQELKNANFAPDDIFAQLQFLGNGETLATPARQAATLTVLAYLFEECDIFERPPEEEVS
jgi:hypothetical protein